MRENCSFVVLWYQIFQTCETAACLLPLGRLRWFCGDYTVSIAKTAQVKNGSLISLLPAYWLVFLLEKSQNEADFSS